MKIKMIGLYGMDYEAWYRKQGTECFDFVNDRKYASDLTKDEVDNILKFSDFYIKQYGAKELVAERN